MDTAHRRYVTRTLAFMVPYVAINMAAIAGAFVRVITAKRFILAAGGAIALFSAWGFVEQYADAPHVAGSMVYPLFWACFAVVSPFVRTPR